MIAIQGQDIPAHARLKSATIARVDPAAAERAAGGSWTSGRGKPHVVISKKIARDYPDAEGSPKKVGQTIRIGNKAFTIVGIYDTGSMFLDVMIIMDIDTARELLGLGPDAVSSYYVEPADPPRPTPWPSGSSGPCRGSGRSGSRSST